MDWQFDENVLATVAEWWGGGPGHWFRGNWRCAGSGGYDLLIEPGQNDITVWGGILQDNVDGFAPLVVCADPDAALKCLLVSTGRRFRDRRV